MKHIRMKDFPLTERPYERFKSKGARGCSDAELLSIILRSGNRRMTSLELGRYLLQSSKGYSGLEKLSRYTLQELMEIDGIGEVKAIQILAVVELAKRMQIIQPTKGMFFTSPKDIADYFMNQLRYQEVEYVYILFLNTKQVYLGEECMTKGSVNASIISTREILVKALSYKAVHIALVHNHPSGDPMPSREDIEVTRQLLKGAQLVGIHLLDHVIIGNGQYYSLKEKGHL